MECEKFVVIFVIFFKMATSNTPQIRPIENYWAMLKMKVYEGNWTGKNRPQMIRRIKQKQKELDHGIVIRMFDNLKGRIHIAKENGLSSLIEF